MFTEGVLRVTCDAYGSDDEVTKRSISGRIDSESLIPISRIHYYVMSRLEQACYLVLRINELLFCHCFQGRSVLFED